MEYSTVLLRDLDTKKLRAGVFRELVNVRMEENGEDKMVRLTSQFLERIGKKRTLLSNILRRNPNRLGHILRTNWLYQVAIEGQIIEVKEVVEENRKT